MLEINREITANIGIVIRRLRREKGITQKQLSSELGISIAYDFTSGIMAENMTEYNAQEGVEAFLQKRNPIWKD